MTRSPLQVAPLALVGALLAACSWGDARSASARVAVDTLPGGIVRTMSAAPVDSGHWSLESLVVIQPADGAPGELLAPSDIALTADGRVLVAEDSPAEVKVYGADGVYERTIGRDGAGPGEFRAAWLAARGDTLMVQDPVLARASTFRISDGTLLASQATTARYFSPVGVDGAGRVAIRMLDDGADTAAGPAQRFLRLSFDGALVDTVAVGYRRTAADAGEWPVRDGDRMVMTVQVPMVPRDQQQVDAVGGFVTGWTGEYLLRVSSDGRDTVALFGRAFTSEPITAADKRALVDARVREMTAGSGGPPANVLQASFTVDKIPSERPPFEQFDVDARGRTWVRRSLADSSVVRFDLFGADRQWLDTVAVPAEGWPRATWASVAWGADRVAVYVEDKTGRPAVYLYRIVRR